MHVRQGLDTLRARRWRAQSKAAGTLSKMATCQSGMDILHAPHLPHVHWRPAKSHVGCMNMGPLKSAMPRVVRLALRCPFSSLARQ